MTAARALGRPPLAGSLLFASLLLASLLFACLLALSTGCARAGFTMRGAVADHGTDGAATDGPADGALPDGLTTGSGQMVSVASFSTASTTFVDVPGAALELPKAAAGISWLLLLNAGLTSGSTGESSVEIRYLVRGVERGLGGAQVDPPGTRLPWQSFDLIDGGLAANVRVQLRDQSGLGGAVHDLRLVALPLRSADIQASDDPAISTVSPRVWTTISRLDLLGAPGERHIVLASAVGSEGPGQCSIALRLSSNGYGTFPADDGFMLPTTRHWLNPRNPWSSFFVVRLVGTVGEQPSFRLEAVSDVGAICSQEIPSRARFSRIAAINSRAFRALDSAMDLAVTPLGSSSWQQKTSLDVAPGSYLTLQNIYLHGVGARALLTAPDASSRYELSHGIWAEDLKLSASLFALHRVTAPLSLTNLVAGSGAGKPRAWDSVMIALSIY